MTSASKHRAIITGASSGIGRATALAFAASGIETALVGRSLEKLEALQKEITDIGVKAQIYCVDLMEIEQVSAKITAIATEMGGVNILVNSAGMGYTNSLLETSVSDWQQVLNLNLTSVFQCILGVLPLMRDQSQGTIINISSIAAQTPFPGWGAYSVSKAGLVALSKTLAAEERANGIRVVTIYPGAVNTPIWDSETVNVELNRSAMLTPEVVAQAILQTALLPQQAVVEELVLMPSAGAL